MASKEAPADARTMRQPGWAVALAQGSAVATWVAALILTVRWDRWNTPELLAVAAFAVASDLASVESGLSKIKFSGLALGTVLAAVRFGGGPAALVGLLAGVLGWFRWREAPHYLRNNLITFAWYPLACGLFFGATTRLAHVGTNDAAYYFLVLPAFVVATVVNHAGVFGYQCYLDGSSFVSKLRDGLVPILSAELFAAVLTAVAVYFVVKTGTIGVAALLVTLAIFQYLVRELLTSQRRGEELRRKATTDELTGLANRARFNALLEDRIASSSASGGPFSVMLIDLDRFKEINDTLGHHYGDVLLRDLGPRLASSVGPDGLVARLGGDEFAVLPGTRTDDSEALSKVAARVLDCVRHPVVVDELTLDVGASIGISTYPADGDNVHDLLRRADIAMYSAKEDHSNYKVYETRLDRYSVRRLTVLSDFRRGLESDEFVLHFQPVVDVVGAGVRGAEALVRWQHPELGLLPPPDFVPIAEQSGLIGPLTRYVLERAISDCTTWRANGHDLAVAVNLSVRDLLDRDLPGHVSNILGTYELPAERLHLEITESMIMSDPERALATVRRLRGLGVKISVDDFGTGYSSLSNLKQLPVNDLKIDRSFISTLLQDESDLIIVRSTIGLGHDLGLNVIAEGVEDEMTLKRLALLGCDLAQGFHLGRPVPYDEFLDSLCEDETPVARAVSA
jgi:diguanylate cyclase (GGDEF)-like protein